MHERGRAGSTVTVLLAGPGVGIVRVMRRADRRRWLVPEVVQTSAMDCGPAALAALGAGFGLSASYGRLREACQTGIDGTSIDTMEDVANLLDRHHERFSRNCRGSRAYGPAIIVGKIVNVAM